MKPAPRSALSARQRRWAEGAGLAVDAGGFLRTIDANLRVPLSRAARAGFERGSELAPRAAAPPRMQAVSSSAALVANVFEYWAERDVSPLVAALGLPRQTAELAFEAPFATGLPGDPPMVDVALTLAAGSIVAIESKFGEWLAKRPRNKSGLKDKYFPPGRAVWAEHGLPRCQALAADLQSGRERFKHLHVAQLLKHALGLAVAARAPTMLVYLYYDWQGDAARVHREEIARFAGRVAAELEFAALTYQALFAALSQAPEAGAGYVGYLRGRYFGTALRA
jgi:hypothetical protein